MSKGSSRRKEDTEKIRSNWEIAFGKKDQYASEEETQSLIKPDTRSIGQKTLDDLLTFHGADEQGADSYNILYGIAVKLIEGKMK